MQRLLRAFARAFVGRCPANWRSLCSILVNAVMNIHIETFVDREPMTESLTVSQLRQVHWNRLFHVYTVLLYGNGAELHFQYHRHLDHSMDLTCQKRKRQHFNSSISPFHSKDESVYVTVLSWRHIKLKASPFS